MSRWPWSVLFCSAPLFAGCESQALERKPAPALDATVPATRETATFALG